MSYLPIFVNVRSKRVVVVGGGKVALHKLRTITRFARGVTVVAPSVLPEIRRLGVRMIMKRYRKAHIKGAFLVYACTDDRAVNARVMVDARREGILVNVADDRKLCDFISPAVCRRGHMTVGVSSQGRNVKAAVTLRDRIERCLDGDKRIRHGSSR